MNKQTIMTELKEYFQQRYQGRQSFLDHVIFPIFGEDNFSDAYDQDMLAIYPELKTVAEATGICAMLSVGTIDVDFNPISIFDITVGSHTLLARNRVGIQQIIRRVMDTYSSAFMIFHYRDNECWDWRFTFCSKEGNKDMTDSKRYTFMLGPGQSCRTVADNFSKLMHKGGNIELSDIKAAFDVEALSEEFFGKYKQHYERFVEYVTGKRFVKKGQKWEETKTGEPHPQMYADFGCNDKRVRDYVKKLLGRIVFLHFLQKKGWMGVPQDKEWGEGDQQFMLHLYEQASAEQKEDFLDTVLEPLFSALDTDRSSDGHLFDTHVALMYGSLVKVPYLNGGLFERDSLDEIPTRFPETFFHDLLDFLYQYNFTIDENDPDDAQVGVDPEMLGRIFENLLEDNKDKGAFYTPKEIVRYMCRQSLTAYLNTGVSNKEQQKAVEDFVRSYDVAVLGGADSPLAQTIDEKLKNVKICDPAIGSGAFPMGLLKELFLCRGAIENFSNAAEIKRHIIQQNIYGVDIERGAIDIARLRFWLSLVVDEETPHTLPNLDFKIMQGNSLLEQYQGVDLSDLDYKRKKKEKVVMFDLFDSDADYYRKMLSINKEYYFSCDDHDKKIELRKNITDAVKKQLTALNYDIDWTGIDLMGNDQFFLWHTWFDDVFNRPSGCNGFDIVIGNPPYVNVEGIPVEDKKIYKNTFSCFEKRADLFSLFLEMALSLLTSDRGIVTFIIPSIIHSNLSYKKLRNLFLDNHWLAEVCYTGGKVFHAPTVDTTILRFGKAGNRNIVLKNAVDFQKPQISSVPSGYFSLFQNLISVSDQKTNDLMSKLFNPNFPRLDEHFSVFQGIVTGNNPAFIFDSETEALSHGIERELLHPLCHGRDIERYAVRSRERRILYVNNSIEIDDYPKTKEWLETFKEALKKRREVKNGAIQWYSLQWPRVKSELDLKEKIWIQRTRNESLKIRIVATLDNEGAYTSEGVLNIIPKDDVTPLRVLLGILDSKLLNYLFATKFLNLAVKGEYLKQLRIPIISDSTRGMLEKLVAEILEMKKADIEADTTALETQIDNIAYHLYGLTYDEVLIVDSNTPISRKEYELYNIPL